MIQASGSADTPGSKRLILVNVADDPREVAHPLTVTMKPLLSTSRPTGCEASHTFAVNSASASDGTRLNALTGSRFFAATSVLAYHFWVNHASLLPGIAGKLASQGSVAVSFFFVLSGFVLTHVYFARAARPRIFWRARFARIYPAYAMAFALALPFYIARATQAHMSVTHQALVITTDAAMFQSWMPWTFNGVNGPGWSLATEVFFYALFPALIVLVRRVKMRSFLAIGMAWWLVCLTLHLVIWSMRSQSADPGLVYWLDGVNMANPILRSAAFVLGMCTAIIYRHVQGRWPTQPIVNGSKWSFAAWTVMELGSLALTIGLLVQPWIPAHLTITIIVSPVFGLLIFLLAQQRGALARVLSIPVLVILGEISYGIYIFQIPVYTLFNSAIATLQVYPGPIMSGAVYFTMLVACALVSLYCVERPLKRAITHVRRQPVLIRTTIDGREPT